jgi:hypothetical protein
MNGNKTTSLYLSVFSESLEFYQYVAKEPELSGEASFTSSFQLCLLNSLKVGANLRSLCENFCCILINKITDTLTVLFILVTLETALLKGLFHEMDLAFDDMFG